MSRAVARATGRTESGLVPDLGIRYGIRRLLRLRLDAVGAVNGQAAADFALTRSVDAGGLR